MNYVPLGSRVLIKELPLTDDERKTGSGIEIADDSIPLRTGEVVAVGIGEYAKDSGKLIPMEVRKGDTVKYLKDVPHIPIKLAGVEYKLVREVAIECIVV